jgi:uncharacterized protein (DUF433 family)
MDAERIGHSMGRHPHLVALGEGAYSVAEVCKILGPTMTSRKVHYWLDTGLVSGQPVQRGRPGVPTVLTFRQLLEIRTIQYLRDSLKVSLPKVRAAFAWILTHLFDAREHIQFSQGPHGTLVAALPSGEEIAVPGGQGLIPAEVRDLEDTVGATLEAWDSHELPVRDHPHVVASTHILGGAPTLRGTRIDTAAIAALADGDDDTFSDMTVESIVLTYPQLSVDQIVDALLFEGFSPADAA